MTRVRGRSLLSTALGLCCSCIEPGTFPCASSDDCGAGNRCEAEGFCSRPDPSCPSEHRFSPYAGMGLAGTCVEPSSSGATSSTGGTGTGSTSSATDTDGEDVPSAGELCGNMALDEDETCDDGNRDNGDGCNSYCREPGSPVWTVTYDDPVFHHEDRAFGVAISPDGDTFAIIGFTTQDDLEGWDILLQLYDLSDGELLWTRTHAGDAHLNDTGEHVAFDPDGNLVAVGVEGTMAQGFDLWIRKYDPDGNVLWDAGRDGGEGGDDKAQGVAVTSSGEIVVAGQVGRSIAGAAHEDIWVARFDGDGTLVGTPYELDGGGHDDQAIDTIVDAQGNAYVTGWVRQADETQGVWTAKIDPAQTEVWSDVYVHPEWNGNDRGVGMALAPDGSLMVAGTASADHFVRRYDPAGVPSEPLTYDGPEGAHDEAADVVFDADGSFIVVGFQDFRTVGFATSDIWVRRFAADNDPVWTDVLDGPSAEIDKALAVDMDRHGGVLVAGYVTVPGQVRDAWIRLYAP